MFDEDMKNYCVEHQYEIPRRLLGMVYRFPHVEAWKALALYELAVQETLVMFNAENLFDEPLSFGRGLVQARSLWLAKMERAERIANKGDW